MFLSHLLIDTNQRILHFFNEISTCYNLFLRLIDEFICTHLIHFKVLKIFHTNLTRVVTEWIQLTFKALKSYLLILGTVLNWIQKLSYLNLLSSKTHSFSFGNTLIPARCKWFSKLLSKEGQGSSHFMIS